MEDLLTSDVFGTMKYAGWEYGFLDWLLKAEPAPVEPLPPPISVYLQSSQIVQVGFSFWPRLRNNREPDVALLFHFDSGAPVLVVVEAKYFSGTSDWEGDEEDGESDPFSLTGNQIADQVRGLEQMSAQALLDWFEPSMIDHAELYKFHLFITMHTALPIHDYKRSAMRLGQSWPIHSYWLSWTSLADCLQEHLDQPDSGLAALLGDLYRLLQRKGLLPFRGFDMEPWPAPPEEPSFWHERWWLFSHLHLPEERSFWRETFWQIQSPGPLPDSSFWEDR
jgi:hypothetical protein